MNAAALLTRAWYAPKPTPLAQALRPLAWLFGALASMRSVAYRIGLARSTRIRVPVVVVGNITAGGSGKTPLVVALVAALRERGFRPGIVSRGHGRRTRGTREVTASDPAVDTGDEPLLLAESGAPVFVGEKRADAAAQLLAAHPDVDVIVADDGLQHYALARDVELAVVDGTRGLGNGWLLPAGPLREPPSRLASVDAVVQLRARADDSADPSGSHDRHDGGHDSDRWRAARAGVPEFAMTHESLAWRNLFAPDRAFDAGLLRDPAVVALAGIANPERFFDALRAQGFAGRTVAFPDHFAYSRDDVAFPGASALLMTEKDAVKCRGFADARMWILPIRARVDPALIDAVVEKIHGSQAARNARLSGHQGSTGS
ncbi:MAG TPA: tetraacyldisaccharide 4'-kinase [Casimicrobiaceae bacterium]|nr:tetraacyldisaccharide 4'-kinase [Casimicrobiaceae bacterium]